MQTLDSTITPYLAVLKTCKLFSCIKDHEIPALLNCLSYSIRKYKKKEAIFYYGDTTNAFGIVLSGSILVVKEDFWGNRSIISEASAGDMFAETYACGNDIPLEVSVNASQECVILFVNFDKILHMCSSACSFHSQLIENLLKDVAQKNRNLTKKMEHMSQRTTRAKLLSYLSSVSLLKDSAEFTIPYNRQELADYLAVERSAMSNELSKLQKDGLLDYDKNTFVLHQIAEE